MDNKRGLVLDNDAGAVIIKADGTYFVDPVSQENHTTYFLIRAVVRLLADKTGVMSMQDALVAVMTEEKVPKEVIDCVTRTYNENLEREYNKMIGSRS